MTKNLTALCGPCVWEAPHGFTHHVLSMGWTPLEPLLQRRKLSPGEAGSKWGSVLVQAA